MKTLKELREEIDAADRIIASEYRKRLALIREVGEVKIATNAPVLQSSRESDVIENAVAAAGEENRAAVTYLFRDIMDYSKEEQRVLGGSGKKFADTVCSLLAKTEREVFSKPEASVACQGAEGAFSHIAANRLFQSPSVRFCKSFRDVFQSVSKGESEFGVLPIENSTAGSVNEVYDLLQEYGLIVVGAKKIRAAHCILGKKGVTLKEIESVSSHPQAISQCRKTLDALGIEKRIVTSNTAVAAKAVAESDDRRAAAIASELTAELYGLDILKREAQDEDRNFTRFIVVSRGRYVIRDGNRISLILSIEHKEGALHRLLGIFASYGKNLLKLESRPIPGKDFEFLFYVDLEANALEKDTREMLERVGAYCKTAVFLGGFREE